MDFSIQTDLERMLHQASSYIMLHHQLFLHLYGSTRPQYMPQTLTEKTLSKLPETPPHLNICQGAPAAFTPLTGRCTCRAARHARRAAPRARRPGVAVHTGEEEGKAEAQAGKGQEARHGGLEPFNCGYWGGSGGCFCSTVTSVGD